MTTLRERLEALAESGESNAWLMVQLLWPTIEAAESLNTEVTRALREAQLTNGRSFVNIKLDCMGVHDALAELEQKLNTGKGEI